VNPIANIQSHGTGNGISELKRQMTPLVARAISTTIIVQNGKKYGANVIQTLDFVSITLPPVERTFRFDTFAPNAKPHNAWVSSWPSTYIRVMPGNAFQIARKSTRPEKRAIDSAEKRDWEFPEAK
jgi:hypothetical protein